MQLGHETCNAAVGQAADMANRPASNARCGDNRTLPTKLLPLQQLTGQRAAAEVDDGPSGARELTESREATLVCMTQAEIRDRVRTTLMRVAGL